METREFIIDDENAKIRVDKAVASLLDFSRKRVKDILDEGNILVNGSPCKASYILQEGDHLLVNIPEVQSLEVLPENIPLNIVYEDDDVIVINKPKGMVVHPAFGHVSGTLVNALMYHCKDLSGINGIMRPGIVHRIDKDTSGLLVVCKNDKAHLALSEQLSNKTCHREYLAIVHHPFSHEHGTINAPIGRDEKDRQKMAVTANNSKEAITHFTVLENFKDYALVRCRLETGRTHQIRVHFSYIGFPLLGDDLYGGSMTDGITRQALHCHSLRFYNPFHEEVVNKSSPLPEDFQTVIQKLSNK